MTSELSEEARNRVADLVALQPTKNAELQERWGLADGSEVHRYLEAELEPYYYRDEESRIRATAAATELVGADVDAESGTSPVPVPPLQYQILEVLAGPDERSQSVVSVLHGLRRAGLDADVDSVRSGLRSLADKGLVEVVQRTVPTFRLAMARDKIDLEVLDGADEATGTAEV